MSFVQKLDPLARQRLFAVIQMFGRQHLISSGDLFMVDDHLPLECGQKLLLSKCLVLGGKDFSIIGRPMIDRELFTINATVVEKTMSDPELFYRHTPRNHGIKKYFMHAKPRTVLRVNEIELKRLPELSD